ncbi:MAG: nucleotidyltransferase family protein [Candidatus Accumulibacter sp. UW20]|jgi:hypothetical protein
MDPTKRTAFRTLCRCLTGALGQPLTAADLPASPAEWEKVLRLSSAHLVTPQLRWALWEQGLFSALPIDVTEYLEAVYTLNLEKNNRCEDQLAHLIEALNCIGVQPVLLKGAAVLVSRLYPSSGERMITDLDILIPAHNLPEILIRLASVGYQVLDRKGCLAKIEHPEAFSHYHYPPIYHPDWPVTVELHVQPVAPRHGRLLTTEEYFRDATPLKWRGGDCLLPALGHFIIHNIIHTFLVDTQDQMRNMSLRQAFEFVLASRTYENRIDWTIIKERFDTIGYGRPLRQYLALANTCFNDSLPLSGGIVVDANDQRRIKPYLLRHNLESRAALWTIGLFCLVMVRLRRLYSDPRRIKRLLDADFYGNLRDSGRRL